MKKKQILQYCILFCASILFVIFNSLRIIYHCTSMGDSIIFNTVGKFWSEGKLPYIDLFDHKGPIIFFINMVSWKLFNCEQGTLFFQTIAVFFTLVFCFKIAKLEIKNDKKSLFFTILTLLFLVFTYSGGNITEEYCLPFITLSLYFNLKYFKNYIHTKKSEHDKKYAFLYGISFAVCFLTRVTNAGSICVGILVILIVLLKEKKYKNIFENAIFFLFGFLVLSIPFAIYFASNHAFYEFLEGTILFNFKYATNSASWLTDGDLLKNTIKYLIYYFASYIILIIGIIKLKKEKNVIYIFYILLGIFETILFLKSRLYRHYAMICLPNFLLFLMELEKYDLRKNYKKILYALILLVCLAGMVVKLCKFKKEDYSLYDYFMVQIPQEEKNSFIAVNVDNYKGIYQTYNICPYYKYFILQDFQASNSQQLYQEMYHEFKNGDVKWILFQRRCGQNINKGYIRRKIC